MREHDGGGKRQGGKRHGSKRQGSKQWRSKRRGAGLFDPRCVLVTGASSGIGAALALHYARPGRLLLLWGRDPGRLEAIAAACRDGGAAARTRAVDLAAAQPALAALVEDDRQDPVELAILAAGQGDMRQDGEATERPDTVLELGLVNFAVPAAMATLLAGRMAARGGGRIALLGSVAAFHDLPFAAGYAGSKAGLARFASALRLGVGGLGVGVVLVSPGFVDTPMSRRVRSAKPFLVSAEQAALAIATAIAANRRHLILPWPFALLQAGVAVVPGPLRRWVMRRLRAGQNPREG